MSKAGKGTDLPTSRRLWRWHVEIETEGGEKKWHASKLLPLATAQREARLRSNVGHKTKVEEDAVAVDKYRAEQEKEAEKSRVPWYAREAK